MQKFSEAVYANLFWLISGLLVWLVIVPLAFICFPVVVLVAAGKKLFQMLQPNLTQTERASQTNSESQPTNVVKPLLSAFLLTTLVELPALLAAVISLQPTRVIKGEPVMAQMIQPPAAKIHEKSLTDTVDLPAEE
jgi:multisubunit Na+/H+ antiporter MnhC subunit